MKASYAKGDNPGEPRRIALLNAPGSFLAIKQRIAKSLLPIPLRLMVGHLYAILYLLTNRYNNTIMNIMGCIPMTRRYHIAVYRYRSHLVGSRRFWRLAWTRQPQRKSGVSRFVVSRGRGRASIDDRPSSEALQRAISNYMTIQCIARWVCALSRWRLLIRHDGPIGLFCALAQRKGLPNGCRNL